MKTILAIAGCIILFLIFLFVVAAAVSLPLAEWFDEAEEYFQEHEKHKEK